jgi:hypothetical protein
VRASRAPSVAGSDRHRSGRTGRRSAFALPGWRRYASPSRAVGLSWRALEPRGKPFEVNNLHSKQPIGALVDRHMQSR